MSGGTPPPPFFSLQPFLSAPVPQKQQGEFRKLVIVGASPTRGPILRSASYGWQAGLW